MAGVAGILLAPPPRDSRTRRSPSKPRNPLNPLTFSPPPRNRGSSSTGAGDLRLGYRLRSDEREFEWASDGGGFDRAVSLFNGGDYHACHDVLEELWNVAEEPRRTLIHGILQCAVGFHHLFNKNHRGAMMELGEGLCKLRKMGFESGPFYRFEEEVSAALDFLYKTQMELAACL
ncbi:hypothetical protein QJS10_CPB04g00565 [Acorus calamus]|uniref:DUF309 domain-containing protein n=1 Tax=Acorus calamus TaxID=4465 RepID=A0AAV9EZP4_ACOCL|nr:hypothetical protein QJS10_CPB04g00565 [Acorus calamus]